VVASGRHGYYFGSYGMIRGYGPLCRTLGEADRSVFADAKEQRKNGGSTDRNAVMVARVDGLCWWSEEDDTEEDLLPVKTAQGEQARYPLDIVRSCEATWAA
jgi:hypothetical protein